MRKTLEIIALVLTIVASLVAIIVFLSGRASLPAFISPSPTLTPTTISPSSPTTVTSPASSTEVDPLPLLLNSPVNGIARILVIILTIIVIIITIPRKILWNLGDGMKAGLGQMFMWVLPSIVSYAVFELLGMLLATSLLTLVLLTSVIVYPVCLFIAYVFKRWVISLE